jgi:hypothetical protein
MMTLYQRSVRRCKTVNALNKVHIALENRMTPLELAVLQSACSPRCPSALIPLLARTSKNLWRRFPWIFNVWRKRAGESVYVRNWIVNLARACSLSGKTIPETFNRYRLSSNVVLFKSDRCGTDRALAICFAGDAQRMMIPTPVFLQHVPAERVDVALIRDPSRNGFRSGIRGLADNFGTCISKLDDLLQIRQYRQAVSIGVSGGGLPAILTALKLGLDAALSVGGNAPDDPRWKVADPLGAANLVRTFSNRSPKSPSIYLVFGAQSPVDQASAEALAALIPSQIIPISDAVDSVGHNAIYPLVKQGKLGEFLDTTVFAGLR